MKTKLSHVRANVSDLQKSIEWYEEMLGFECTGADITDRWSYADFECGEGATFAIVVSDKGTTSARFNFVVDNADMLWEKLKDKVTIVEVIETMPYGNRKFTIADPDGNEIGLVQQN
jgi:catechol 2,3-dioxygenase-like lactoylglutathione lyase family enzyme